MKKKKKSFCLFKKKKEKEILLIQPFVPRGFALFEIEDWGS